MNRDDELNRFKTDINFVDYAESKGYVLDVRESSRASKVMRSGDDKIIVATDGDGHGVYFNVKNGGDSGSIIDFVQQRQGLSLGHVRKELRPWTTGTTPSSYRPIAPVADRAKPVRSSADRQRVLAVWMQMESIDGAHPYLQQERKIAPIVLADPRFAGAIRTDAKGNAVFPHYDKNGISGYELKNKDFTGFATGGRKALWQSTNVLHADSIVVVESAIDALSHAQLHPKESHAYISIGGTMSPDQEILLKQMLQDASVRGAVIVLGVDNDAAGESYKVQIQSMVPAAQIRVQTSTRTDWNEDLKYLHLERVKARAAEKLQAQEYDRYSM